MTADAAADRIGAFSCDRFTAAVRTYRLHPMAKRGTRTDLIRMRPQVQALGPARGLSLRRGISLASAIETPPTSRGRCHNPRVADQPLSLEFASLNEARALHKMLFERKFDSPEGIFFGSPFIAAVQHRLLELIIKADSANGRAAARPQWEQWRQAEAHPHVLTVVRRHLTDNVATVAAWTPAQREAYVRTILAPLIPSEALLRELTTA